MTFGQLPETTQILVALVTYYIVTLVVAMVRGFMDYRRLSWVGHDGIWSYLYPRLTRWIWGPISAAMAVVALLYQEGIAVWFDQISQVIGIFSIPLMVIGGYLAFCLILGILFAPAAAAFQDWVEIG